MPSVFNYQTTSGLIISIFLRTNPTTRITMMDSLISPTLVTSLQFPIARSMITGRLPSLDTPTIMVPRTLDTFASPTTNNHWLNINSRTPSIRFGTGHVFNSYFDNVADGINTRDGAQVLVENNVFVSSKKPLYSTDSRYAVATGNDFGGASNTALVGTLTKVPYSYTKIAATAVKAAVVGTAGNTLSF